MSDPPIDPHDPQQHVLPPGVVQEVMRTFTAMQGIDSVIRESVDDVWDSPLSSTAPTLDELLRALGTMAGQALGHELLSQHSPEWLSKKAADTARSLTLRPFMAGLNSALGLPEEYEG